MIRSCKNCKHTYAGKACKCPKCQSFHTFQVYPVVWTDGKNKFGKGKGEEGTLHDESGKKP